MKYPVMISDVRWRLIVIIKAMLNLQVAVADDAAAVTPWMATQEGHKSKWPGQILSAATLNDQQKIEPIEKGLGRVEAGESL